MEETARRESRLAVSALQQEVERLEAEVHRQQDRYRKMEHDYSVILQVPNHYN